jgi:hypothetical protein
VGRPLAIDDRITDPRDPEKQVTKGEAVIGAISIGVPRAIAAVAAGISEATFYRWVAQGAEYADMTDEQLTDDQRKLREFRERVEKADAGAVVFAVEQVRAAMPDTWQAAMTWLERRYPNEWGRRLEVKTDPTNRRPAGIDADLAARADETFRVSALPADITPDDFLPKLDEDESAEAGAEAPA